MKKYILIFTLVFVKLLSQEAPQTPLPPEMSKMLINNLVGINEYSGKLNLNIPIYTINLDGLVFPIQINYDSGGVKLNQEASEFGLNWSINMPAIVQIRKGKTDYFGYNKLLKLPPFQGNPVYPSEGPFRVQFLGWNQNIDNFQGVPNVSNIPFHYLSSEGVIIDHNGYFSASTINSNSMYYQQMFNGALGDTEPDIFVLNLNGDVIKFCQSQNLSSTPSYTSLIVINGKDNYKVNPIFHDENNFSVNVDNLVINGFEIIDPSGNKYYFDERVCNQSDGDGYGSITYYLSSIITSKNKSIDFSYTTINDNQSLPFYTGVYYKNLGLVAYGDIYDPYQFVYNATSSYGGTNNGLIMNPTTDFLNSPRWPYINNNKVKYLNRINFLQGDVLFEYSERTDFLNSRRVDKILIKNKFEETIETFDLEYDVITSNDNVVNLNLLQPGFNSSNIDNRLKERLYLKSIKSNNLETKFEYFDRELLPNKSSFSFDFWGYCNGQNNLSPYLNLSELGYLHLNDNNQNSFLSNLNFCKLGTLKKIEYPTGGFSEFEYELNSFDNLLDSQNTYNTVINYGAGLRIKKEKNYSSEGVLSLTKVYSYYGGINISKSSLVKEVLYRQYQFNLPTFSDNRIEGTLLVASNNNFINQTPDSEGNYIGYNKVESMLIDFNSENNGYVVKEFYNQPNNIFTGYSQFNKVPFYFRNTDFIENGKLKKETVYNNNGEIKLKTTYFYNNISSSPNNFYGLQCVGAGTRLNFRDISPNSLSYSLSQAHLLTFYPIKSFYSELVKKEVEHYFPSGSHKISEVYNYDQKRNLSGVQIFKANDFQSPIESKVIEYAYINDSFYSNLNIFNLPKNIYNYVVGQLHSKYEYTYSNTDNRNILIENNMTLNNLNDSSIKTFFELYDDLNNVLQFKNQDNITTSIIYGYHKTLPVAKLENISYSQIPGNLISQIQNATDNLPYNESALMIALQSLRSSNDSNLQKAMITTYTHKPLVGVTSITSPNGDIQTYHYDSSNRLIEVRDKFGNTLQEHEYHYRIQN